MISKTRKFWDKQAKRYDHSERQFDPVFKEVILCTRNYLTTEDKVLDFGCATGSKTIEIADSVKHIHGLDISSEMVKEANRKIDERHLKNISFSQGDIRDNNFEMAAFDKIISYGVIHLLANSAHIIQKLYDLLKPGGLFITTTACLKDKMAFKNSLEFKAFLGLKKLGLFPLHLNMYAAEDVERLMLNQGFKIVKAETIFHGITVSFIIAQKG